MAVNRWLAFAGYALCAYLGVVPLVETALSVWPLTPSEVAWRYGTVGLFTRALMVPLLGLCLAVGLALHLGQRNMVRSLAAVSGAGVLVTLAVLPLFLLDAVQMRAEVNPDASLAFDIATAMAVTKMVFTVLLGVAVALGGWKATRGAAKAPREGAPGQRMVFRAGGAAPPDAGGAEQGGA